VDRAAIMAARVAVGAPAKNDKRDLGRLISSDSV
jgi:hypothetical protein